MSCSISRISFGVKASQVVSRPAMCAQRHHMCRRSVSAQCSQGFSSDTKAKKAKSTTFKPRKVDIAKELGKAPTTSSIAPTTTDEPSWIKVATLDSFDKPIKAVILKTGKSICLYKVGTNVYCSDASSTAYQYPLVDAKILDLPEGPAVEVPLDGTQYDLKTGKVLKWCPTDTAVRAVLGTLKKASKATDLPMYKTKVSEQGNVFVTFV